MKKNLAFKTSLLFISLFSTHSFSQGNYKTASEVNWNYNCEIEWSGGVDHQENSHSVHRFNNNDNFKIYHISKLPIQAVKEVMNMVTTKEVRSKLISDDDYRLAFENNYLQNAVRAYNREKVGEIRPFLVRDHSKDPDKFGSYTWCDSSSIKGEITKISCDRFSSVITIDGNTNRFISISPGTWHTGTTKGYSGDSSVFAYGRCKKTYE
ncbi:hypothetical protein [Comamonas sp.]|uniref:hypothetical protein n=1 Tax=Comamonas sp. TaxID=34028 RepID=UPI0028A036B1|nr:hypothetical protein [Comamonas sp.]